MKPRWMAALSVLSVVAILGAGFGVVACGDDTDGTAELKPLLTEEQLADLRAMMEELRASGLDRNETMALIEEQVEQYITENLEAYGLTDEEIVVIMDMFEAIGDKMAEIKEVAYEMRENGATFEEIREAVEPLVNELKGLQDQLVETLEGYAISFNLPLHGPHHGRPEGPRPPILGDCTSPRA